MTEEELSERVFQLEIENKELKEKLLAHEIKKEKLILQVKILQDSLLDRGVK